jgi:hypothetical protein
MFVHRNSLECGLFMSGSAARGCGTRPRGGTRPLPACPACPAARGYQTPGGGARSFEEAEETRQLLEPRSDISRGNPG